MTPPKLRRMESLAIWMMMTMEVMEGAGEDEDAAPGAFPYVANVELTAFSLNSRVREYQRFYVGERAAYIQVVCSSKAALIYGTVEAL